MENEENDEKIQKKLKDFFRDLSRVLIKHKFMVVSHEASKRGEFKIVPLTKNLFELLQHAELDVGFNGGNMVYTTHIPKKEKEKDLDVATVGTSRAKFRFRKIEHKEK